MGHVEPSLLGQFYRVFHKCGGFRVDYEAETQVYKCGECDQVWNERIYVLVEHPEETSLFEDKDIGYPSAESRDGSARYVPEYEYIRLTGKDPEPCDCFKPVCWPQSQHYMTDDPRDPVAALNELINDEKGIEDFGPGAIWVPLCNII